MFLQGSALQPSVAALYYMLLRPIICPGLQSIVCSGRSFTGLLFLPGHISPLVCHLARSVLPSEVRVLPQTLPVTPHRQRAFRCPWARRRTIVTSKACCCRQARRKSEVRRKSQVRWMSQVRWKSWKRGVDLVSGLLSSQPYWKYRNKSSFRMNCGTRDSRDITIVSVWTRGGHTYILS